MIREGLRVLAKSAFQHFGFDVVPREVNASALIEQVSNERDLLLTPVEAEQLFRLVRSLAKISGHMAEVGVYSGASSKIIREADSQKPLHLFDTFAGLPLPSVKDQRFQAGMYSCSLPDVQDYLACYSGIEFYEGTFPFTADPVKHLMFSFVHLDVDLYQSTLDALRFFWPRMVEYGAILSHDYGTSKGVVSAFDEFFSGVPQAVIHLSGAQCLVVR